MWITRTVGGRAGSASPLLLLAILLIAGACRASSHVDTAPLRRESARWNGDAISMKELTSYPAAQNLYEVLRAARPFWIIDRGKSPSVSIDGAQPREVDALRGIQVASVREVRLLRAHSSSEVKPTMLPSGAVEFRDVIIVNLWPR